MHVYINEQEVMAGTTPGATIGEVIEASRMHVDPTEIVTSVELDGVAFHAGDDKQYARFPSPPLPGRDESRMERLALAISPSHSHA